MSHPPGVSCSVVDRSSFDPDHDANHQVTFRLVCDPNIGNGVPLTNSILGFGDRTK